MGEKEDKRRRLKRRLFVRDGWQDATGEWSVMCAFDCGEVIGWHTSTINMHPIKKCDGGTYRFDNTRLACIRCNAAGCNYRTLPTKHKGKRKRPLSHRVTVPPKPLSVSANIDRLQRVNARREARVAGE